MWQCLKKKVVTCKMILCETSAGSLFSVSYILTICCRRIQINFSIYEIKVTTIKVFFFHMERYTTNMLSHSEQSLLIADRKLNLQSRHIGANFELLKFALFVVYSFSFLRLPIQIFWHNCTFQAINNVVTYWCYSSAVRKFNQSHIQTYTHT